MALTQNYTHPSGATIQNAYHKITSIRGSKDKMTADISVFVDAAASNSGKPSIGFASHDFVPDLSTSNFIAQGYASMKALDEYSSAGDV